jgi:hypothetical protein
MISETWFTARMIRAAALPPLEEMLDPPASNPSDSPPAVDPSPALKAMLNGLAKGNVVMKKPNGSAHG